MIDRIKLRRIRRKMGLTQAQLAERLGLHQNTVACMERGDKSITNPALLELALRQLFKDTTGRILRGELIQ